MRMTQGLIPTIKETPSDAEIVSHKLMIRSGMMRKLGAGIYNYLPLGLKVIRKVEQIVREEMDRAGAQELLMPILSPSELWKESGRWDVYGKELMRIKDRHGREFALGPTHEEIITDIARSEIKSYRELPINLYQIQTKFRDEIRPRFGVMRAREFIMKDAYSFHPSKKSLKDYYRIMHATYTRIFERCGLNFKAVLADSGAIGGDVTHEFLVLAESGESLLFYCEKEGCGYAATSESATGVISDQEYDLLEVLKACDEEIGINPNCAEAWCNKGVTLAFLERYEEALKACAEAIGINPNYAEAWYNKGVALCELERYEEALKACDEAIGINPNCADAWYNKGVALGELERPEEELKAYDEAIRINPKFAKAWYNKGVALDELERYEEALKAYDEAIRINPNYADAWYNKGVVLGELGRPEEELKACDEASRLKLFVDACCCVDQKSDIEKIKTPDLKTVEDVSDFFKVNPYCLIKTLIYKVDDKDVAVILRGDREVSDPKLQKYFGTPFVELSDEETVKNITGADVGFAGPVGLSIPIYADSSVKGMQVGITGANATDYHYKNVVVDRDFEVTEYIDVAVAKAGDGCPKCGNPLSECRGIEVGQIFQLGEKYSKALGATYNAKNGEEKNFVMGCYGIGITRTVASAIEQSYDDNGIIWPYSLAPYHVAILIMNVNDKEIKDMGETLYTDLTADGYDVLLDDRDATPGFKFKDADLIGTPIKIILGKSYKKEGLIEIKKRVDGQTYKVKKEELKSILIKIVEDLGKTNNG